MLQANINKDYKQYFTPLCLAEFMVNLIPEDNIHYVIDLSMGECGLLEEAKKRWSDALYFGADIDETLLNKIHEKSPYIKTFSGDSLGESINSWMEYQNVLENNKYDLALANPPFNFFDQNTIKIFDSNEFTLPIEICFLLKYIDIVREGGYVCIILPYGFLSLDLYKEIRKLILTKVNLMKVIKIFPDCFDKIDADTCLILMKKKSDKDCSIQEEITIEYLNNSYLLERIAVINNLEDVKRLDLEYHKMAGEMKEIHNKCIYPIDLLSSFVLKCNRGRTLTHRKDLVCNRGKRFLHTTDVKNLHISNKSPTHVSNRDGYFQNAFVELNNILIGRVGKGCIGKVTIVNSAYVASIFSDCLFCISVKNIDPYYLTIYLATQYGQKQLFGIAKGSCSRYITKEDLLQLKIIVPDKDIQDSIREKYINILSKRRNKDDLFLSLVNELEEVLGKGCK